MSQDCFSIEELSDLLDRDSDDPRLEHVRDCARCRNLLAALREFGAPTQLPSQADIPRAEAQLKRFITENVDMPQPTSSLGSFFRRLIGSGHLLHRPVTGLALAAVVLVIVVGVREGLKPSEPFLVRDAGTHTEPQLVLHAPEAQSDGGVRLSWEAISEDATYEVVLYSSSLDELARFAVGNETAFVINPDEFPSGRILWQIEAAIRGNPIATSQPAGIPNR